jgi:hypothetical protein
MRLTADLLNQELLIDNVNPATVAKYAKLTGSISSVSRTKTQADGTAEGGDEVGCETKHRHPEHKLLDEYATSAAFGQVSTPAFAGLLSKQMMDENGDNYGGDSSCTDTEQAKRREGRNGARRYVCDKL